MSFMYIFVRKDGYENISGLVNIYWLIERLQWLCLFVFEIENVVWIGINI